MKVIYNPVASNNILKLSKEPVSHPFFNDKNIPIIIAVGRLTKAKDYMTLLKALKILRYQKNVRLIVIGKGEEDRALKKFASDSGIGEFVDFLGFRENPFKYMAKSDIFVNSSVREGFGNSIVEAMCLGIPVVATMCSGPKEILGEDGILVKVGDSKALSEAIGSLLDNQSLSSSLSQKLIQRANDFSINKSVEKYEAIFND